MIKLNDYLPEKIKKNENGMKLYFNMPLIPYRLCFAIRGNLPTIVEGKLYNYVYPNHQKQHPSHAEDDLAFLEHNEDYFEKDGYKIREWIDTGCKTSMTCRSLIMENQITSSDDFLYFEPRSRAFIVILYYQTPQQSVFLRVACEREKFVEQKIKCPVV